MVRVVADGFSLLADKWTNEDGCTFRGIEISELGNIYGIKPINKKIFFYGDSITEGTNAIGINNDHLSNSSVKFYPWYCCEKLKCIPYFIGYSGTGIIMTFSFASMIKAIDYLGKNRKCIDRLKPDLIVINHGVNDLTFPSEEFECKLRQTLNRLIEKYPDMKVIYMVPFNGTKANEIKKSLLKL